MRLFFAVDLAYPETLRALVGDGPEHFHVTLRFLGEMPEERRPDLEAALAEASSSLPPFPAELQGLGAFPSEHAPRLLWAGFGQGEAELLRLAGRLDEALAVRGIPPEARPFRAHATVRRLRGAREEPWARELVAEARGRRFDSITVEELVLYESRLTGRGAVHRRLAARPLSGPP
jgi:2'-5' RNA ligase